MQQEKTIKQQAGEIIAEKLSGMDKTHFCKSIGFTRPTLSKMERGSSEIGIETYRKVLSVLEYDLTTEIKIVKR